MAGTPIWELEGVAVDSTGDMVADSIAHRLEAVQALVEAMPAGAAMALEATAQLIKAVTDLIPDAGAMTSIAQESTLEDVEDEVEEVGQHVHNVVRWWGATGAPNETNAIADTVTVPFVAISGNDTWGTAIPIKGTADNPVLTGMTEFDPNELLVVDTDHTTPYKMRIIFGNGTSADAITAGQCSEVMFITAAGPFSSGVPVTVKMPQIVIVGWKLWAQVWNATNLSNVDFFWDAHGYPYPPP